MTEDEGPSGAEQLAAAEKQLNELVLQHAGDAGQMLAINAAYSVQIPILRMLVKESDAGVNNAQAVALAIAGSIGSVLSQIAGLFPKEQQSLVLADLIGVIEKAAKEGLDDRDLADAEPGTVRLAKMMVQTHGDA